MPPNRFSATGPLEAAREVRSTLESIGQQIYARREEAAQQQDFATLQKSLMEFGAKEFDTRSDFMKYALSTMPPYKTQQGGNAHIQNVFAYGQTIQTAADKAKEERTKKESVKDMAATDALIRQRELNADVAKKKLDAMNIPEPQHKGLWESILKNPEGKSHELVKGATEGLGMSAEEAQPFLDVAGTDLDDDTKLTQGLEYDLEIVDPDNAGDMDASVLYGSLDRLQKAGVIDSEIDISLLARSLGEKDGDDKSMVTMPGFSYPVPKAFAEEQWGMTFKAYLDAKKNLDEEGAKIYMSMVNDQSKAIWGETKDDDDGVNPPLRPADDKLPNKTSTPIGDPVEINASIKIAEYGR